MFLHVIFQHSNQNLAVVNKTIELDYKRIEQLRKTHGYFPLDMVRQSGATLHKANYAITITDDEIAAKRFRTTNQLLVNVNDQINDYVILVFTPYRHSDKSNIHEVDFDALLDEEALIRDWKEAGCPTEWSLTKPSK